MRIAIILFSILGFFGAPCAGWSQSLQFEGEIIRVDISTESCVLIGEYLFRNASKSPIQRTLYYPFVISDTLPPPDSIVVWCSQSGEISDYHRQEKAISFPVTIPADTVTKYTIVYRQTPTKNYFEYILTTTAHWGKPLKSADFIFMLAHPIKLQSISYAPDSTVITESATGYYIHRTNFSPKNNLSISWE